MVTDPSLPTKTRNASIPAGIFLILGAPASLVAIPSLTRHPNCQIFTLLKPYPPLGRGIPARVYAGGKWLRILVCPPKLGAPASLLAFPLLQAPKLPYLYFAKALPSFGSRDSSPRLCWWQVVTDPSLPTKTRSTSIPAGISLSAKHPNCQIPTLLKPYPPLGRGIPARVYAGGKWLRILVCPPKLGAPASLLAFS